MIHTFFDALSIHLTQCFLKDAVGLFSAINYIPVFDVLVLCHSGHVLMSLCYCQPVVAGLSIVLMRPRLYFYLHVDQRPRCSAIWYPETLLPLLVQKPYYECLPLHSKRVQNESFNIQTTYAYTLGTDKLIVPALWGCIRIGMVKQFCEMLF